MTDRPQDDVLDLYQAAAGTWNSLRDMTLFEAPWLDAFSAALPGTRVLDLGCGTGRPIAAALAARGCRITGVDGAPAMIGIALATLPAHRWLVADMRNLPPIGPFDGIVAWHSLFHLPPGDQPAMFARFAGLAAPGGVLLMTSGTERGTTCGRLLDRPLFHGSLDADHYRRLLVRHGFTLLRHRVSDPACGGATVWLARRDAGSGAVGQDPGHHDEQDPRREEGEA